MFYLIKFMILQHARQLFLFQHLIVTIKGTKKKEQKNHEFSIFSDVWFNKHFDV